MIIMWVILFLPAGTIKFWEAWILWLQISVITLFITVYFAKKNPEFLSRRIKFKGKETTKKAPVFLKLYYLSFILPGIDFRFHWSNEQHVITTCSYSIIRHPMYLCMFEILHDIV